MKRFLPLLLVLFGCTTPLAKDVSEPAAEKGYPSAEFSFNGEPHIGLGVSSVEQGSSLSVLRLSVQGYLDGTVSAVSKSCGINLKKTYTKNALIEIPLSGEVKGSCVISVAVLPHTEYGEVSALKGEFLLKAVPPGKTWQGHALKIADYEDELIETVFPSELPVNAVIAGCSREPERFTFTPEEGAVYTSTRDFIADPALKGCVAEGVFQNSEYKILTSWLIRRYDGSFSPLPDPEMEFSNSFFYSSSLKVTADSNVLAIISDGETIYGSSAELPLTKKESTIRLITTSGRTLLCKYNLDSRRYHCLR